MQGLSVRVQAAQGTLSHQGARLQSSVDLVALAEGPG